MSPGVMLGPDGVPRNELGEPIGARGTTASPEGDLIGADGAMLDEEIISSSRAIPGEDATGAAPAGGGGDDDEEGMPYTSYISWLLICKHKNWGCSFSEKVKKASSKITVLRYTKTTQK